MHKIHDVVHGYVAKGWFSNRRMRRAFYPKGRVTKYRWYAFEHDNRFSQRYAKGETRI